jgi:pimeloyl-ACP methyl ester carboxylesterase
MDQYVDRPGARIAYRGSGPSGAPHTVVVTHALATSREWEDEAGILDWSPVADAGSRLVRYDTRGHGASSGDTATERYTWPFLAGDLLAVADTVSPDRPVDALSESTGCGTLLWAVLTAPHRFRRLALVIPPTRGEARAEQAELYTGAADMIEVLGIDSWRHLVAAAVPPPILQEGGWAKTTRIAVKDDLLPAVLRGAAASTFPDDAALRTIQQPTLILAWDTDPSHPVGTAEHLGRQLPNSTLEIATTPEAIRGWGARAAAFLEAD